MQEPPGREFCTSVRVYIEDTDAAGIVYYANYFKFMERARTEMFRSVGLQQSATFKKDIAFVVYSIHARFLQPALMDEELEVTARLTKARAASLVFEQTVRKKGSAEQCCTADVTIACISLKRRRPRRIPPEILKPFTN